jgi:alkylated DNA repair dioxygenase AlkB
LAAITIEIETLLGFKPNNCLINYYLDGKSKMGFHSDQTDILEQDTGIVILSIGETRILRFKSIEHPDKLVDFSLSAGSLIYMTQEVQKEWLHAIPLSNTDNGRMSLTFRRIK